MRRPAGPLLALLLLVGWGCAPAPPRPAGPGAGPPVPGPAAAAPAVTPPPPVPTAPASPPASAAAEPAHGGRAPAPDPPEASGAVASTPAGATASGPADSGAATSAPSGPVGFPPAALSEAQLVLHVLDRLGYGPRPGDVEVVRAMGLDRWIDAQLHPERLDDHAAEARLAALRVPGMGPRALMDAFPLPGAGAREGRSMAPGQSPRAMIGELAAGRVLRAVYSERQLLEVMVDFWLNHFNVFAGKGAVRYYLPEYERLVIRPRALGRFRDLLGAVARHPAMLYYLDAWLSVNENYARELLELHTLGVDGGYTQADIVAVARAFTGWTIDHPRPGHPRSGGGFVFAARAHDRGAKTILGHAFPPGGGWEEGERVLDLLARHPATARFLTTKLARRFVADDPPAALVERAAAVFRETDGDIRAVVGTIARSPEFAAPGAFRAKVKTPLEFVASALRALGAETDAGPPILRALGVMGQPLYGAQAPTGYPDRAESWANPGGLLARLNFAQALAGNRLPGTRVRLTWLEAGGGAPEELADRLVERLLGGTLSAESRGVIQDALGHPAVARAVLDDPVTAPDVAKIAALVLGAPEFQRR